MTTKLHTIRTSTLMCSDCCYRLVPDEKVNEYLDKLCFMGHHDEANPINCDYCPYIFGHDDRVYDVIVNTNNVILLKKVSQNI